MSISTLVSASVIFLSIKRRIEFIGFPYLYRLYIRVSPVFIIIYFKPIVILAVVLIVSNDMWPSRRY